MPRIKAKPAKAVRKQSSEAIVYWVYITADRKIGAKESTGTISGYIFPANVLNGSVIRIVARSAEEAIEYYKERYRASYECYMRERK